MSLLKENRTKEYLLVSDFDQTLSFNDSGIVLSELLGVPDFQERIRGLSDIHMVSRAGNWLTCSCTTPITAASEKNI